MNKKNKHQLFASFTFYFFILGAIVVIINLTNNDDKNLLLIGLNPILNILSDSKFCKIINNVPYLWHLLSIFTITGYGLLLDYIMYGKNKYKIFVSFTFLFFIIGIIISIIILYLNLNTVYNNITISLSPVLIILIITGLGLLFDFLLRKR